MCGVEKTLDFENDAIQQQEASWTSLDKARNHNSRIYMPSLPPEGGYHKLFLDLHATPGKGRTTEALHNSGVSDHFHKFTCILDSGALHHMLLCHFNTCCIICLHKPTQEV
jgi:hypothetical protein